MGKIENSSLENDQKNQQKLLKISTYSTVFGVLLIIIVKTFGWFETKSMIMLASLIDSLLDACVSVLNLLAVRYALMPADYEHRFGHTKIEDIAVFVQSFFFGISGFYLIYDSLNRLLTKQNHVVSNLQLGIWILVFSTIITYFIIVLQHFVMKKVKSNVIEADSKHYLADFLINLVSIISILLTLYFGEDSFDSFIGLLLGVYIIYSAYQLFKKAFNNLMDHELPTEDKQIIVEIIKQQPLVLGFHDFKTRHAGVKPFFQFHIELDENTSLKTAHQISHDIEEEILAKFPAAEIIIHQDPFGIHEKVSYKD